MSIVATTRFSVRDRPLYEPGVGYLLKHIMAVAGFELSLWHHIDKRYIKKGKELICSSF